MFKKKIIAITVVLISLAVSLFSSESATTAYMEGCKFYSQGDWASAEIMLKKAVSYPENFNPDVYYMLITAEVYNGSKKSALDDCNVYLNNFPESSFYSRVKYHKGKILYDLGEYEKAIIELSDFCHQYVDDELYSFALFYIGESLFAGYKYEEARGIFDRIVVEFPDSEKAPAAQYRIDTILQYTREEKLLYLLKQTGEEYLSAKEEYEKQLKMYNSETVNSTRQKLSDAQVKNSAFEKQIADLQSQLDAVMAESKKIEEERDAVKAEAEKIVKERDAAIEKSKELEANQFVPEVLDKEKNVQAPVIDSTSTDSNSTQPVIKEGEKESAKTSEVKKAEVITPSKVDDDIPNLEPYDETKEQLRILKEKAREVQRILDSKNGI